MCEENFWGDSEEEETSLQLPLFPVPKPKRMEVAELISCTLNKHFQFQLFLEVSIDYGNGEIAKDLDHVLVAKPWELEVVFSTEYNFSPLYHFERKQIIVNNLVHLLMWQDLLEKLQPMKTLEEYWDNDDYDYWLNYFGKLCHHASEPEEEYDWISP